MKIFYKEKEKEYRLYIEERSMYYIFTYLTKFQNFTQRGEKYQDILHEFDNIIKKKKR